MGQIKKESSFKERLEELFQESGESITGFAKQLGLTRQTVSYYLNGDRVPDILVLSQICERMNVSADWLLGKSATKSPDATIQKICEWTGLNERAVENLHWESKDPESIFGLNVLLSFDDILLHRMGWNIFRAMTLYPGEPGRILKASDFSSTTEDGRIILSQYSTSKYFIGQSSRTFEEIITTAAAAYFEGSKNAVHSEEDN